MIHTITLSIVTDDARRVVPTDLVANVIREGLEFGLSAQRRRFQAITSIELNTADGYRLTANPIDGDRYDMI